MSAKIVKDDDGYWRIKDRNIWNIIDRKGYDKNLSPLSKGFYWVKLRNPIDSFPKRGWYPAFWDGKYHWWIIGSTNPCASNDSYDDGETEIAEVGELCK